MATPILDQSVVKSVEHDPKMARSAGKRIEFRDFCRECLDAVCGAGVLSEEFV